MKIKKKKKKKDKLFSSYEYELCGAKLYNDKIVHCFTKANFLGKKTGVPILTWKNGPMFE